MAGTADEHDWSSRPPHSLRIGVARPVTWQRSRAIWPTLAGDLPTEGVEAALCRMAVSHHLAIAVEQLFINPYRLFDLPLVRKVLSSAELST